jgi:predicted RNA-binding protein YlxR (DUF448 family)
MACRVVRPKPELVRLVRGDDRRVRMDPSGSAPGRGAYVCPNPVCLRRAGNPGKLAHAFKKPCEIQGDLVEEVRGLWQLESK